MKTLKLDHELAAAVIAGTKTSTWRLFDEKNISVNDQVLLIDKVNAKDKSTWVDIGTATVSQVTEKRLGELSDEDWEGHDRYADDEEMYQTYRSYYGPQVGPDTPVKLIHFSFRAGERPVEEVPTTSSATDVKLFTDGGSRGNPGPSASGYVLMDMQDNIIQKSGLYLGITTNNQAEYQALKFGLEAAQKLGAQQVAVHMDSMLVVNQMKGLFKVKNRDLWPIHESIQQLASQFKKVTYTHVPRELNKLADAEVNTTLDAEAGNQQ